MNILWFCSHLFVPLTLGQVRRHLGKTQINLVFRSICTNFAGAMEKMTEMKAALFDLDGVVFDTEPQYTVFWGEQCREFHPEHPGLEHEIKGQTLVQIYDAWFSGPLQDRQALITERLDRFEQQMAYEYVPGFETFVRQLRQRGVRTAVVTSSNRVKMEAVYQAHPEFRGLFDAILTSEDFSASKPDPDCYLKAARRLGANREECVVFEDSFNGLRSGRAAGMHVVGLATTNPADAIRPFCDEVIKNYINYGIFS